jgi:ATP/maltotriose-dependent transcriptional regulator MalT
MAGSGPPRGKRSADSPLGPAGAIGSFAEAQSVQVSDSHSTVPVPERDVLLATKLRVPVSRPDQVPRPRLTAQLDEGLVQGLVLVCAPAGYGKTVLLADWARRSRHPVAWLSLDAGDNDPARFWRHLVAAVDRARPGTGGRVAPLLGPPAPSSFQGLVTALINELAADEAVVVLDDYHLIGSPQVHESLAFLVEHRPAGICVVLASRSDPPLPLARLRARGQLTEIRAAELRFTPAEAGELLGHAASALPDGSVAALAARTEGWAAGLALAALSLRGQDDAAAFVAAFTGSHRYVLDYLAEEVLEGQDEQQRTFLLETSVLDRLSGPLCNAITGREGGQALLEEAERAGLFVIPLDEVRGWWRYHHLFADLLRARLRQEQPGRLAQLHRNAAAWYEQHGLADDAIGHAAAAGEMLWAARIIEQHFDAVYYLHGEAATIKRWLAALPGGLVRSRPRLLLARAQMAAAAGRVEEVEATADAAERASADADEEPFEPTVGQAVSMLVNVTGQVALERSYLAQLRGDAEATAMFAARVLACSGEDEWLLRSTARGFLAVAEWLGGRLGEAERAFGHGIADWRGGGQATLAAWGSFQLCQVQQAQGHLDAAVLTCRQALEPVGGSDSVPLPTSGPAHVGLSEVAYQRNQLDLALRHVTEGHRAVPPVRLHAAAVGRPGDAGVDPPGQRRQGQSHGGDRGGRAGLAGPA